MGNPKRTASTAKIKAKPSSSRKRAKLSKVQLYEAPTIKSPNRARCISEGVLPIDRQKILDAAILLETQENDRFKEFNLNSYQSPYLEPQHGVTPPSYPLTEEPSAPISSNHHASTAPQDTGWLKEVNVRLQATKPRNFTSLMPPVTPARIYVSNTISLRKEAQDVGHRLTAVTGNSVEKARERINSTEYWQTENDYYESLMREYDNSGTGNRSLSLWKSLAFFAAHFGPGIVNKDTGSELDFVSNFLPQDIRTKPENVECQRRIHDIYGTPPVQQQPYALEDGKWLRARALTLRDLLHGFLEHDPFSIRDIQDASYWRVEIEYFSSILRAVENNAMLQRDEEEEETEASKVCKRYCLRDRKIRRVRKW